MTRNALLRSTSPPKRRGPLLRQQETAPKQDFTTTDKHTDRRFAHAIAWLKGVRAGIGWDSPEQMIAALGGDWKIGYGRARCLAHNDDSKSLHISELNGKLLVHCTNCRHSDVVAALTKLVLLPLSGRRPLL